MMQRRASSVFAAVLPALLACSEPSPTPEDLVGQLRSGAVMCIRPAAEKQCNTIARHTFLPNGEVRAEADVTMSPSVVMSTVMTVIVRSGAICQTTHVQDVDDATFVVGGRPATQQEATSLREQMKSNMAGRGQVELCMTLALRDGDLMVDVTLNGVPRPEMAEPMIWIRASDGYTAGPGVPRNG